MRCVSRPLVHLSLFPLLAAFAFACAPAAVPATGDADEDGSRERSARSRQTEDDARAAPPSRGQSAPPIEATDAGTTRAPDAASPPTTQSCTQLSTCCGSLQDYGDKLACMGVALANDPDTCAPALVVCQGGGVGLGGYFQSESPGCGALTGCCEALQMRGDYSNAKICQSWVEYGDETGCGDTLASYQKALLCK